MGQKLSYKIMLNLKKISCGIISLCVFLNVSLCADWNKDFDNQTTLMVQQLTPLQNAKYLDTYQYFQKVRAELLNDRELVQLIKNWNMDEKLLILKENLNIIIKKRRNDNFNDLYPWELSYLINSNAYILPSFPMKIGGKIVIIQKLESFQFGSTSKGHDLTLVNKVSLKSYWKALLQAYILGIGDLVSANIGVNQKGIIRFFDNEYCLDYNNTPLRIGNTFKMGFLCQAIDWPQFRVPMDAKTAKFVQDYVRSFCNTFDENMKTYLSFRPVDISEEGLKIRLNKLRTFKFREGKTFNDFHGFIYPRMNKGLDKLSRIVSNILKVDVGIGLSLFFVTRRLKRYSLSADESASIQKWIEIYVGH
jgi:hypothetical protein